MPDTLDGLSMDLERANLNKLRAAFPECFSEGKLDIDKLLGLCGEYIDNDFEKYRFEWKGKAECLRLAQKRSTGTLRPCPEESVNWDSTRNLYIEGDNLEVLKLLQSAYYRKVKMIYIDPPYNTGNDFVYADDFADPLSRYKEVTAQTTKSNPETMGRFHTNWLNMMYPRLRLAANLLRDDGVIFISIDDSEVTNLRRLCDEVFGEENFVDTIIWEKRYSPQNAVQWFSESHDFILVYAKRKDLWFPNLLERTEEMNARYKNIDNDPRGPWKASDSTAQGGHGTKNQFYVLTAPNGKKHHLSGGLCWRYTEEAMQKLIADNRVWFGEDGNNVPAIKKFLSEVKQGVACKTIWGYNEVGHSQEGKKEVKDLFECVPFDTPKPTRLLERIVKIATGPNDIILDFFSGSATTAHAVMQLNAEDGGNRRFILVQLPEVCAETSEAAKAGYANICEIGKERIRRVGLKLLQQATSGTGNIKGEGYGCGMPTTQSEWETTMKEIFDIGFRVFKLDTSNLKTWDGAPVAPKEGDVIGELENRMNAMIHRVKPDRSELDMAFEVMLKLGVPPTYPVTAVTINGKTAYSVGEDCLLLVCLAPDVRPEDVEQMAGYAPAKAIISRDSFANDTAMANAYYILRDRGVELKLV